MKVLHLISGGDTGGARTHVHLLLKHLNKANEATLVCFMEGPFAAGARDLGIPTVVLTGALPGVLRRLRAMLRERGYEVLHCHGSRANLIGMLLKRSCKGSPLITTVHSDPRLDYRGRPLANLIYGTLNAIALRRMDYYVSMSDMLRERLISRGFDAARIFTIYNGVEFDDAPDAPAGEREAFYREVGLDADARSVVVGIGARFDAVKDLPTLLRGFAAAYKKHPRLRLLIAGDGMEREKLENLAKELGIGGVTCFAGWQTDMRRFFRCIDINTLTSLSEGSPYAIPEGARERLCTVSTRVGSVPKMIIHGETGFLFEPGDVPALGETLSLLAEDEALRRRMGDRLYEKVKAEYSAAATAEHQLRIYARILADHARRARGERAGAIICGAYGMSNAGDEAVLEAMMGEMRSLDSAMPVTLLSRTPKATAVKFGVNALYTFNVPRFLRSVRGAQLYLNGGGSLIQDVTSSRSLWFYLFTLAAAKRQGCRVLMYGCGIGPVRRPFNRRLAARVINRYVDAVTLREEGSFEELRSLGVTRPEIAVASDPALTIRPAGAAEIDEKMRRLGLDPAGAYLCFCLRSWPGLGKKLGCFARAADYAYERYGLTPVFLSINTQDDGTAAEAVAARMSAPRHIIAEPMPASLTVGLVSRMRAVVSVRLHGLIFAAGQGIPVAGVSYDPKVPAFLKAVGQDNCVTPEGLTEEKLLSLIDRALGADREALRAAAERLRERESLNIRVAERFLREAGES